MKELFPPIPKAWNLSSKPHLFCPGCGHGLILKALGEVIDELNIQERVVYGCDIGCSLLSWNFLNCDTIQTHHGRTTPVIMGLKRADPEAIGIAYMGDGGGYAIGLQHLISSAVRNEKIFVLLVNNTNYGMTGGQMAPTTLPGQKTQTTPYGRDTEDSGPPILGPEMINSVSSNKAYVARASTTNPRQLKKFIKKALKNQIENRGFSFLEVLSFCPTNWRTSPSESFEFVEKEMMKYFKVGEIKVPKGLEE